MYNRMLQIILLLCFTMFAVAYNDADTCSGIVPIMKRLNMISIIDYGGVGDGKTVNTKAFREAINSIQRLRKYDGTTLYIPPGVFLTDNFNLTSYMTLYLATGAVIQATQTRSMLFNTALRTGDSPSVWSNENEWDTNVTKCNTKDTSNWPLADPLPSYGRGRERLGGRYMSFILGDGVHDVTITGENGTIDGQGDVWWNMWRKKTLPYTRPHLVEFIHSTHISISNVVFKNSPFWNIHPVYCSNVVVRHVTILAPADSPNTDGIDPDSSSNVCIEDSYISNGDDLIAIKSGWDEYGIAYGRSSSNITIRRITGSSPFAGIAIGSETSGGVENVLVEHINLTKMGVGIHIKTNVGRGGYIRNITISDVYIQNARKGIKIAGNVGDHPDQNFDPNANPIVRDITLKNIHGKKILLAGLIKGIKHAPFMNICLSNISFYGLRTEGTPWECSDVKGSSLQVSPSPCSELINTDATIS